MGALHVCTCASVPVCLCGLCAPVLKHEQDTKSLSMHIDLSILFRLRVYVFACVKESAREYVERLKGCQSPSSRVPACQWTYVCLCDLLAHQPYRLAVSPQTQPLPGEQTYLCGVLVKTERNSYGSSLVERCLRYKASVLLLYSNSSTHTEWCG